MSNFHLNSWRQSASNIFLAHTIQKNSITSFNGLIRDKEDVFQSRIEAELHGIFHVIDDDLPFCEVFLQTEDHASAIAADVHVIVTIYLHPRNSFQINFVLEN